MSGLGVDDKGTVTFSDATTSVPPVQIVKGVATAPTVDLSSLADGPIMAALSVSDAAGNTFTANASATLDRDATESPTVVFADANIGVGKLGAEGFTVSGLDVDDNGAVTFSDGNPADTPVQVSIVKGAATSPTVNLNGLMDGQVTAALSVSDAAGNTFTANASATLDIDAAESPTVTFAAPTSGRPRLEPRASP